MKKVLDFFKNEKVAYFIGGAAAIVLGKKFVQSDCTRKAAVKTMAKAMKLQSDAQEVFSNMKEDAQDLCYDAKAEAGLVEEEEA